MNGWLAAAAAALALIGICHSWLGERKIIGPLLLRSQESGSHHIGGGTRRIIRGAWHLTSVTWIGGALIFLVIGANDLTDATRGILMLTTLLYGSISVYLLLSTKGRHVAWPLFLAVSVFGAMPLIGAS